jgi:transposase
MKTPKKQTAEHYIKEIRRNTRRIFSSEQKIQIVMEALRAEMSVAELCRKYSIHESQFYKWNKEFLEAGKKRLSGGFQKGKVSLLLRKFPVCCKLVSYSMLLLFKILLYKNKFFS